MTEQQRESKIESAIHILKKYDKVIGFKDDIDLNKVNEQLLLETDEQFNKTFSIILLLDDLTQRHIEIRDIIESVSDDDNYIVNTYLERN